MPLITDDTFDPLRRYVSVRLQQAVPIVDADWNERDDIDRYERRALVKWFIGDGIPAGLDSFRIEGTSLTNDFMIRAGTTNPPIEPSAALSVTQRWNNGLSRAGRCLVDGMEVIITRDLAFTEQPLHQSRSGAATLAARLGVSVITMPAPAAESLLVYLDVWERLVRPTEDPLLQHPGLGVESCVRLRREWAVRVRRSAQVPQPTNDDFLEGHSYCALASITRQADSGTIRALDVNDIRRTGLTLNEHLRVPLLVRKGVNVVDSDRFVLTLRGLRTSLLARLREGRLPHQTGSVANENVFLTVLQNLMQFAQSGEVQTLARSLDNPAAIAFLQALYIEQRDFLNTLQAIGNVGTPAEVVTFLSDYRKRLEGSVADNIRGLKPALDAKDFYDATIAQELINQFLSAPIDNLPEGILNVFYVSVTPFQPLVAATLYTFRFEVESLLSSPLGNEAINLQATLSAASWQLVSVTPAALTLTNSGGRGTVDVVIRPNVAATTCTLTFTAIAARNPLLRSTQPGIALQLGTQPPVGSQFLFYSDSPLNADGQLELRITELTDPFGRDVAVRLVNNNPTARTYRLVHQVAPTDGVNPPWTPNPGSPGSRNVELSANTSSTQAVNLRCTAPTANETAIVTVTATVVAIGGSPVADGVSSQIKIPLRVISG